MNGSKWNAYALDLVDVVHVVCLVCPPNARVPQHLPAAGSLDGAQGRIQHYQANCETCGAFLQVETTFPNEAKNDE